MVIAAGILLFSCQLIAGRVEIIKADLNSYGSIHFAKSMLSNVEVQNTHHERNFKCILNTELIKQQIVKVYFIPGKRCGNR